ncbi:hypothetical protein EPI10_014777 [Gossypium australe]|uniref:Uncharacterized protein n=1 Tax=Gossypium australe TaxID=47621 RepID=A0A5B6VI99_9ROSI|nr:hypothetical protein EPI10_014777 [Gossypium australe]
MFYRWLRSFICRGFSTARVSSIMYTLCELSRVSNIILDGSTGKKKNGTIIGSSIGWKLVKDLSHYPAISLVVFE